MYKHNCWFDFSELDTIFKVNTDMDFKLYFKNTLSPGPIG